MIVSKLVPSQDTVTRYVLTQGSILWSDNNWYMNPVNSLWIQLVLAGVKSWLKSRKTIKMDKKVFNFQFINTLNNLVSSIENGFGSEIKMSSGNIINPAQSSSNKTSIKLSAQMLSDVVDSISVPYSFFDNGEKGSYIQVIIRESEKIHHKHLMLLAKMPLSKNTEAILSMLRTECDSSNLACEKLLFRIKQRASQD